MRIVILPSAQADLADGFRFYEGQQEGLGSYFLESLFSNIDSLRLYAGIHRKVLGFYRALSKRFPYAIYYDQEGKTTRVWAYWTVAKIRSPSSGGLSPSRDLP